jgi:hypothetical protein
MGNKIKGMELRAWSKKVRGKMYDARAKIQEARSKKQDTRS